MSPEDYYNAMIKPYRTNPSERYESFIQKNPALLEKVKADADDMQDKFQCLYVGMRDCVRSVMCQREVAGYPGTAKVCHACLALSLNQAFRRRVDRAGSASSGASKNQQLEDVSHSINNHIGILKKSWVAKV